MLKIWEKTVSQVAENGQNSSNENQKSDVNGNKDEKVAVGETPT